MKVVHDVQAALGWGGHVSVVFQQQARARDLVQAPFPVQVQVRVHAPVRSFRKQLMVAPLMAAPLVVHWVVHSGAQMVVDSGGCD